MPYPRVPRWAGRFALLLATACGPTLQLTPSGRDVELVTALSPDDLDRYHELQVLTCSRKFNARNVTTNVLQCQNELRNKAADLGADFVYVTSQQLGQGDCGNCVTMIGTAYRRQ